MKKIFAATFVSTAIFCASAQQVVTQGGPPPQGGMGMMAMSSKNSAAGTITAVSDTSLTIKTVQGKTVTAKTSADTRFNASGMPMMMRQGGPGGQGAPAEQPNGKLSDFKVGDAVLVRGAAEGDDAYAANTVMKLPPQALDMLTQQAAAMGKTIVAGEIKAIDETKLTIARVDGVTQTIEVDENTSFMKMRENITLADFKVGDNIMAQGELKNGTFVAKTLRTGGMRIQRNVTEGGQQAPPPASH